MKLKHVPINYGLLAKAQEFYAFKGYEYIETPWIVDTESSNFTFNDDRGKFVLNDIDSLGMWSKHLVGSAEQGFIQIRDNLLTNKKYMSISPCFRKGEDDETHCEQFIKLELFMITDSIVDMDDDPLQKLDIVMFHEDAKSCFASLGCMMDLEFIQTSESNFDINARSGSAWLEIGSYGSRDIMYRKIGGRICQRMYYGTGLALPRFQLVI